MLNKGRASLRSRLVGTSCMPTAGPPLGRHAVLSQPGRLSYPKSICIYDKGEFLQNLFLITSCLSNDL